MSYRTPGSRPLDVDVETDPYPEIRCSRCEKPTVSMDGERRCARCDFAHLMSSPRLGRWEKVFAAAEMTWWCSGLIELCAVAADNAHFWIAALVVFVASAISMAAVVAAAASRRE